MSQLKQCFERAKAENRAALIAYLTAGDPSLETSFKLLDSLAEHADIIEIGVPFSDPMADGPVIQAASERALAAGTTPADVFALAGKLRDAHPDVGIVLMGYANSVYVTGIEVFAEQAKASGVDGILLVDVPPEESGPFDRAFQANGIDQIRLLAPTSTEERVQSVCNSASGFIYFVSLTGITGAELSDMAGVRVHVQRIRQHTRLPIGVGFGIKSPEQAAEVGAFADGVVVGSAFVSQITCNLGEERAMITAVNDKARNFCSGMEH